MSASARLASVLADLSRVARQRGLSDSAWARLANLPRESLSRLLRRRDCNWVTLERLASAVGQRLAVTTGGKLTTDHHFPARLTREHEQRLYKLVRSGTLELQAWLAEGPAFFMAGLAVLIAGSPGYDRPALLRLGEALHPGISELAVFNLWLQRTPVEPSRFFAQLEGERRAA
jgi:hypothetical protein